MAHMLRAHSGSIVILAIFFFHCTAQRGTHHDREERTQPSVRPSHRVGFTQTASPASYKTSSPTSHGGNSRPPTPTPLPPGNTRPSRPAPPTEPRPAPRLAASDLGREISGERSPAAPPLPAGDTKGPRGAMVETGGGRLHQRRGAVAFVAANKALLAAAWVVGFALVFLWQSASMSFGSAGAGGAAGGGFLRLLSAPPPPPRPAPRLRPTAYNLTDFGAVGDGRAVNTEAFERAVETIAALAERGGGQLNVPPGRWLTAPFNLTSHMTLFLAEGAEILGITDEKYWPLMPALPSYGYGRECKGPRFGSLIHGQNLKDVVITGHNGSINGQGEVWWMKHRRRILNNTRPPLVQLMWSKDIIIANITLRNSPFWHLHPYDCTNVTVSNVTILSPVSGAPNTDGIDPDSSQDVLIENCYISVGDDAIAIKSGWDQYGIAYGRPSSNISIRNVNARSLVSAGISIGSEMSGGVANVTVENVRIWESRRGVRIKTATGRGGYIRNISYRNITFDNVRAGIVIKVDYNEHADDGYDRTAFPDITSISFKGIHGRGVRVPVRAHGSDVIPIRDISFQDMSVGISYKKKHIFQCSYVEGRVVRPVFPKPCENLDIYDEQGQLVKRAVALNSTELDYDI